MIRFCTFNQAVNQCSSMRAFVISAEEPVFAADGEGADDIFNWVVVDFEATILGIQDQFAPVVEAVVDGFSQWALWWRFGLQVQEPGVEFCQKRQCLLLALCFNFVVINRLTCGLQRSIVDTNLILDLVNAGLSNSNLA